MISAKNKFLTKFIQPIYFSKFLPVFHVAKLLHRPKKVISLSANGIGTPEDPVFLTAHRGVQSVAPQNSLPAYKEAVKLGYYSSECDIRLTSDNQWVLIHNDSLDAYFIQKGKVEDFTFDELRSFKYNKGANFWAYEDMKISTLDEYLDVFVGSQTRPQIEIKSKTYDLLHTVVEAVEKKGLVEQSIIISFDYEQLVRIHELNDKIELWYLIDEITQENIDAARAIGDNVWLSPNYNRNTDESIKLALDNGIGVSFWTVNKLEDAKRLYNLGVRYIETDIFHY